MSIELRVRQGLQEFEWEVVTLGPGQTITKVAEGSSRALAVACDEARKKVVEILERPEPPARHEFECPCGAQLTIEARRSKRSPYTWDSPREITCQCQRTFGVKLQFAQGRGAPRIEAIAR